MKNVLIGLSLFALVASFVLDAAARLTDGGEAAARPHGLLRA